jgi:hypothetical protein
MQTANGRKPRMLDSAQLRRQIIRLSDVDVYTLAECGPTPLHRSIASQIAHARAVAEARQQEAS